MLLIGESIAEAIDWAQDKLKSTRPVAESVLFSMIADKKIVENKNGFVLRETADDDDTDKEMKERKQRRLARRINRPRFNFGNRKRALNERRQILRDKLKALGCSDEDDDKHFDDEKPHVDDPSTDTVTGLPRARLPTGWV